MAPIPLTSMNPDRYRPTIFQRGIIPKGALINLMLDQGMNC